MSVLAWTWIDEGGTVPHRPATDEVFQLFRLAYWGASAMPPFCPLPALQEQTDALGIPWLSVMAGLTQLVNRGDLEQMRNTHAEVVELLGFKTPQRLPLAGAKTCTWCKGTTVALVNLEHEAGTDLVCGSCAEEYAYFVTQDFYQVTEPARVKLMGQGGQDG